MKKLTLQQQLKIQLDLLPEEQTHQLKKTIEKSEEDSNIASMIDNTLSSKNIQTPFKKNDFELSIIIFILWYWYQQII